MKFSKSLENDVDKLVNKIPIINKVTINDSILSSNVIYTIVLFLILANFNDQLLGYITFLIPISVFIFIIKFFQYLFKNRIGLGEYFLFILQLICFSIVSILLRYSISIFHSNFIPLAIVFILLSIFYIIFYILNEKTRDD